MAKYVVTHGALVVRGKMVGNGESVELSADEIVGVEHLVSKVDAGPAKAKAAKKDEKASTKEAK